MAFLVGLKVLTAFLVGLKALTAFLVGIRLKRRSLSV